MQMVGHSERTGSRPALSLFERLSWVDKLPVALISGLLLGLSGAPYGFWWLAWICITPLLLLVFGSKTKGEAALMGLTFGFAYHMLGLRWLFDLHPMHWFVNSDAMSLIVGMQLWILESLHQALLFSLFAFFLYILPMRAGFTPHYKRPFFPVLLSVPVVWVFLQWFVGTSPLFLGVPINQLAYGQVNFPAIMQIAHFGGAQSVEFLILLCNIVLACFISFFTNVSPSFDSRTDMLSDRIGSFFDIAFVTVLIAVSVQWGQQEVRQAAAMPTYPQPAQTVVRDPQDRTKTAAVTLSAAEKANYAPPVPIAVVQGGLSLEDKQKLSGTDVSNRYASLTKALGVGLIVLPAGVIDRERQGSQWLAGMLPRLAHDEKKDVIVGARELINGGVADSIHLFGPLSPKSQVYVKYRLIPFAEYTPLGPFGTLLSGGLSGKLAGGKPHVSADFLPTLVSIWGRIGTSIGPELVYPDLILNQVNKGASLLVNVSDLSYFHKSVLGQELIAAAAFRAVETGRYFVIACNSGSSAVIDPHGIVTSQSLLGHKGLLFDRVQFLHKRTPFTRLCLWTPLSR